MPLNEVLRKSLPLDPKVLRKSGKQVYSCFIQVIDGFEATLSNSTRAFTTQRRNHLVVEVTLSDQTRRLHNSAEDTPNQECPALL